ncbi:MarR family winged helix-turn-helix transcriptional regulator [Pantoea cypripedii]|uniref:MarR family winged helix-turn-helix transcriptional regulator n=1 Tax=Pantoea cypripedii TaxID=55209 RepID=UPI001FC983BA|nr:MarR family transcriptional regulator [Pantoea cypripedii]MBP2198955.1 DNA-binding MarR family transcriptional regulator [Pantoea cypripedii]
MTEKLAGIGLTLPEWRIMRIIHSYAAAIPMSIVIEHSQSDRSTLGRTVERLVNRGWVEKLPDPTDKRAFLVRRLEAAETVYSKAYELVAGHDADMLRGLSADERTVLTSFLQRIESRNE